MPANNMGWNPTSGEDGETRLRYLEFIPLHLHSEWETQR